MRKIVFLLALAITPTFASATSTKCADNFNQALKMYREANSLYKQAKEEHDSLQELKTKLSVKQLKAHLANNDAQQQLRKETDQIIELIYSSIDKDRRALEIFKRAHRYNDRAQNYCSGSDRNKALEVRSGAESAAKRIESQLDINNDDPFIACYACEPFSFFQKMIITGSTDAAINMLKRKDFSVNLQPKDTTPLLITAAYRGRSRIAKALLDKDAVIDIQNDKKYTALELAGISGNAEMFTMLFERKASPFLLNGFHSHDEFANCNIADLVELSSYSKVLSKEFWTLERKNQHNQIITYLKSKGLSPSCQLKKVVARVNGNDILQPELYVHMSVEVNNIRMRSPSTNFTQDLQDKIREKVLNGLVDLHLQADYARANNLRPDAKMLMRDKGLVEKLSGRFPEFTNSLLAEIIETESYASIAREKAFSNITVTDNELQQYYRTHPDQFQTPAHVKVLRVSFYNKNDYKSALKEVHRKGVDFRRFAAEHTPGAIHGGRIDDEFILRKLALSSLPDEAKAIAGMNVGEIKGIDMSKGNRQEYMLVKVINKVSANTVSLEDVQDRLRTFLRKKKAEEELVKWNRALRAKAKIVIF